MAFATDASAETEGVATIVRLQGEARYTTGDNIWHTLEVGAVLHTGATIQTAAGASVDIVLDDKVAKGDSLGVAKASSSTAKHENIPKVKQNVVRMWGDTVLAIDKLLYSQTGVDAVSETQLDLKSGKIFGTVKKLTAASKYEIKTPTGVAGIRGTTYSMASDNVCVVYEGSVVISSTINGQTHTETVSAGQSATVDPVTGNITVASLVPAGQTTEEWAAQAQAANGSIPPPKIITLPTTFNLDTGTQIHVSPVQGSGNPESPMETPPAEVPPMETPPDNNR